MSNSKKRKRSYQFALVCEIILCLITLLAITLALFFLFKYHAIVLENEEIRQELSVYNDPSNPYYSSTEVESMIIKASEDAAEKASQEAVDELLYDVKNDLIENSSSIRTIRRLFPDDMVVIDDNKYYFFPIDKTLKSNVYDITKYSKSENGRIDYIDNAYETSIGIDVSKFQNKINWKNVANDNIDFAIIRLGIRGYSEGELFEDDYFENNIEGALENKLDVGVYFFTQATSDAEAIEEADFVLDKIEPYNITYPVIIDVETVGGSNGRGNALSMEERTQYTRVFCDTIKKAGYTPMIYGNLKTFTLMLDMSKLEDIPKWFAGYTDEPYFPYAFDMWQYTDTGDVSGISTEVDINIYYNKTN